MKILVINGPNMQLLGRRKAEFYGTKTLPEIEAGLRAAADFLGVTIDFFQSNHEGAICDRIASAMDEGVDGIVINPAAYTHTSIAIHDALEAASIHDALEAASIPAVEVHMSNIHARDDFRRTSLTAPACIGQIAGLGADGYELALRALVSRLSAGPQP